MNTQHRLKPNCLGFLGLLAQNIALISPTMTAALIVPLMFSTTGNTSWVAYAVGTVMLLFVAFNLNQFAKRTTAAGSMYTYSSLGLGPTMGAVSGWALIWAYLFIGLAGTTGFTVFASKLLTAAGLTVPPPLLFALCLGLAFTLCYKGVQMSTMILLFLEGISCLLISALCLIVLGKHGFAVDHLQLDLKSTSLSSMGLGVVVAIFSLVGFESSTAFGEEAKNPLKTIPRSIIWSLIATGLFFIVVSYTEVLGTRGYTQTLDQIDAPLNVLASMYHVDFLSIPLSIGAMTSFFALALSCMNAGARVMFAMGRQGFFHKSTSHAHADNETPHVSLLIMAIVMFIVVTTAYCIHSVQVLDEFNDAGTMGAFGFLAAYVLIALAAPAYLKKIGQRKPKDIMLCVAALLLLLIPAVGSVYPVPPAPVNYFPYVFLAYMFVGVLSALCVTFRSPEHLKKVNVWLQTHLEHPKSVEEPMEKPVEA